MTTARDLITIALADAGIIGLGQSPSATDIDRGLTRLNDMIAQWMRNRWLIWHLIPVEHVCDGSTYYTIGAGATFDTPRPDRLEAARITQNNPPAPNDVGWPLELVQSMEAYNNIRLQHLGSFPRYIFYDSAFPTGKLYPWPLPSNLYTLRVLVKEALQSFTNLNTVYAMPEEYKRAIRFNLQEELLSAYQLPDDERLSKRAMAALNVIRNANAQIPVLSMPNELVRGGFFNVFSGDAY